VSLGKLDDDNFEPLTTGNCQVEGVAVYTAEREPGPYKLRLERQGEQAEYSLIVLKNRLTELVVELEGPSTYLGQYLPLAHRQEAHDADTFFKLDRAERALQRPESARGVPSLIRQLLALAVDEPMVLLLRAYLVASGAPPAELGLAPQAWPAPGQPQPDAARVTAEALDSAAKPLIERFPELPDGYVAHGWALEGKRNPDEARKAYRAALDRGLPVLALFLRFLDQGFKRLKIADHPRADRLHEAAKHRIPLLLWSAWRPERA
jgi:hypothetical protein